MGFALLTGGKASAKEKVSDFWKNAGHLKQVKEEAVDITDEEYEEVVEEAAEFVENMEAVDVEKMKEKSNNCIVDEYSYTPKYSYNQTSGSTTGKICALYNQQYQGDLPICWASTVATIVNYRKGIYITGKDVCDAMFTGYVGKNVTVATEALQHWGCNYTVTWKQLAWDVIVKNINKKYPIYVHASNATAGKGHAVTLYGYMNNNSSRYITIWNTASNNYQTITYKSSDTSFISSSKVFVWSRSSSMH